MQMVKLIVRLKFIKRMINPELYLRLSNFICYFSSSNDLMIKYNKL